MTNTNKKISRIRVEKRSAIGERGICKGSVKWNRGDGKAAADTRTEKTDGCATGSAGQSFQHNIWRHNSFRLVGVKRET
jgi:hypothetical protein